MDAVKKKLNQKPMQSADKCIGTKSGGIYTQENQPTCFKALQMVEQELGHHRFKTTYQSEYSSSKSEVQRSPVDREAADLSKCPLISTHSQSSGKRNVILAQHEQNKFKVQRPQKADTIPNPLDESDKRPEAFKSLPREQKIKQRCHLDPCGVPESVKLLLLNSLEIGLLRWLDK